MCSQIHRSVVLCSLTKNCNVGMSQILRSYDSRSGLFSLRHFGCMSKIAWKLVISFVFENFLWLTKAYDWIDIIFFSYFKKNLVHDWEKIQLQMIFLITELFNNWIQSLLGNNPSKEAACILQLLLLACTEKWFRWKKPSQA